MPISSRCWINTLKYTAGIDPDGEVYLCSPWSRKDYSIGNVNKNRLIELWDSDQHIKVINKLNNNLLCGKCNPLVCRHYYSNLAIDGFVLGLINALSYDEMAMNYGMFI